jgi:hypothetical protein
MPATVEAALDHALCPVLASPCFSNTTENERAVRSISDQFTFPASLRSFISHSDFNAHWLFLKLLLHNGPN